MTQQVPPAKPGEEIWELNVPGRVHVEVTNHLGHPTNRTVAGKGSRLRISTMDRELAEEQIRNAEHNPFRNGMLMPVGGSADRDAAQLSDEDLASLFTDAKDKEFDEILSGLSEVNVRRMAAMAQPVDASLSQSAMIKEQIENRWPIGGTTPTWEEMQQKPKLFS